MIRVNGVPTILLDLDDVITDFIENVLKEYNSIYGTEHKHEDITEWEIPSYIQPSLWTVFEKSDILKRMPLKGNALDTIKKWHERGWEVIIVTGIEGAEGYLDKLEWLKNTGLEEYITDLIPTRNKYLVQGDMLIDDNLEYLKKWDKYNRGIPILMTANHNKKDFSHYLRLHNWEEIDRIIDKIFKLYI